MEICEIKLDELSRYIFKYAHFPKPGIFFRRSECLQPLRRNHYKKVMHVMQLSHVLQGEVVQVFVLFKHTH